MSNPSFINIDQWLFEWREGNLSLKQIEQLELFLLNNPDLDIDKEIWEMAFVSSIPLNYPHKELLLRKKSSLFYYLSGVVSLLIIASTFYFLFLNSEGAVMNNENSASVNYRTDLRFSQRAVKSNQDKINAYLTGTDKSLISRKTSLPQEPSEAKTYLTIKNTTSSTLFNENTFFINNHSAHIPQLDEDKILSNDYQNPTYAITGNGLDVTNELGSIKNVVLANQTEQISSKSELLDSAIEIRDIALKSIIFDETTENDKLAVSELTIEEEYIEEWKLHRTSAPNTSSFSRKWNNFERNIKRMANNPIALKNLKDPLYHVPGMLANDINFSAAGNLLATRIQASSRFQWMGQNNEQLQNQISIDSYAYPLRAGIGVQINQSMYHKNGIQNTSVALTYSPKFSINRNITLEPGVRFKMGTKNIDTDKMVLGQSVEFDRRNPQSFYSKEEQTIGKSLWYKDVGFSLMANTKWFYLGAQIDNVARHYDNIYGSNANQRAPLHGVISVGTDYESKNYKFGFSPYIVYQNFGNLSEAWFGSSARVNWLTAGVAISSNYEPAASLGLRFKHFAMNYTIDYTKSISLAKQSLSHQLTLRFLTNPSRAGQRLLNHK
jgi:type IX secretion system PorP/SprF family membrane protein